MTVAPNGDVWATQHGRDALFQQSFENEKNKGDALSKRFEEALKEAKKEPVSRPLRGFDLD
ncbi:hypothetical protein D3C83_120770 [compost metagenome]